MSDGLITRQELSQDLNEELNKTGILTNLKTTEKGNLVSSVNEVFDKTTLLYDHLGTIEQNLTLHLADFVDVQNKTGVLSNLVTSAKTTLVHAINETYNRITTLFNQLSTQIGTLSSLTTSSKTNLVSAINETYNRTTTLFNSVGTLSSLKTSNKTSVVNAINEIIDSGVTNLIQPTKPRQSFIKVAGYYTGTYYTVADVTGKGILSDIVFSSISINNEYMYIRITVDGASHVIHPDVTVEASGAPLTSVSGSSTSSYGGSYRALKWSGLTYFNNSLKVEFRCDSKSGGSNTPEISGVVSYALV